MSVDERVVRMSFDNAQFQQGVQATLNSLAELNKGLKLQGATKGLTDLGSAAKNVDLGHIASGVDAIKSKFGLLSVVGIAAIANLTSKAVDAGIRMTKAFTIDPIKAGFQNYETQINAVQTILANTGLKGKAGLDQVTAALGDLNEYANKTVYNFSEMAKNVGTFTAAGVKLDVAKEAIKGIANLAALSGSNSEQASTAMYQLSQAIAANKVGLQDWNSVVNAGLGGQVFQKALFDTGQSLGTIKSAKLGQTFEEWTKAGNSFRGSLQSGWITGKVLTQTLSEFTGDMTAAQLKSKGYNAEQIQQIMELGKVAVNAATQIKTYSQMTQALKEEVASAYASIFKTLFGDINGAIGLFTPLHNVLQNLLTGPIYAFDAVLEDWVKLGGKVLFIDALKTGFKDLHAILLPISKAYRDIFPATTGKTLYDITKAIDSLFHSFKMGVDTAKNLRSTFAGLFAILDIGWQLIKQTAMWLDSLLGPIIGKSSGGILKFTGNLGNMLVNLDKVVKKGVGLNKFFIVLGSVIQPVINFLGNVIDYLLHLGTYIGPAFDKIFDFLKNIGDKLKPAYDAVQNFFKNLFTNINFDDVLKVVDTGLFAALAISLKKLFDHFRSFGGGGNPFTNLVSNITAPFTSLTETLEKMQKALSAAILMEIALAVAALTVSVIMLSKINQKDLDKALQALMMMFVQLFVALAAFNRIGGAKGMVTTGAGLILIATAIRVLVGAVKSLSDLSWDQLKKGMTGVGALLLALVITVRGMSAQSAGMVTAGAGLVLLAAGIKILVSSVQDFSKMSWEEIKKGLIGVGSLLVALTLFTRFAEANKGGIAQGAGIILLATGIKILASAAQDFGKMNWDQVGKGLVSITAILLAVAVFSQTAGNPATLLASGLALNGIAASMLIFAASMAAFGKLSWGEIAKGLVTMGVSLGVIALAMHALPANMIGTAIALNGIALALVELSKGLQAMGSMSWEDIAKSLITLAGALTIIAVAVIFMEESLAGAAAILVVATAVTILGSALEQMGQMSWEAIGKSLAMLAGAFLVLGVSALALTPVAPILLVLSVAMALFGVGLMAVGTGVLFFSAGLTGLAASGAAGAAAIGLLVTTVAKLLPMIAVQLGLFLVALAGAVIKATPPMVQAAIVLIDGILKAVVTEAPKIIAALVKVINDLLSALVKNIPNFVDKTARIIIAIADGITRNAPRVIASIINMLVTMLNSIAAKMPEFVAAAANLIVQFLTGIANNLGKMIDAGVNMIVKLIEGIGKGAAQITEAAFSTLFKFLSALDDQIKTYEPEIVTKGLTIAGHMITGLIKGIVDAAKEAIKAALGLLSDIWDACTGWLDALSPSKKYMKMGGWIAQGLAIGITGGTGLVIGSWTKLASGLQAELKITRADITNYTKQLAALNADPKKNALGIYYTTIALREAKKEYLQITKAIYDINKNNGAQHTALLNLAKAYDALTPKIADATQKLEDAKKVRDDFAASITQQIDVLPDITGDTQLADYVKSLQYQVNDLSKFTDVLSQLRKMGLNDALYKQLLAKGPAVLGFAEQLLAGGTDAVTNLDKLSDQLDSASVTLGKQAGDALYQAGVDAAQGLVDGLKAQQAALIAQMKVIADALVAQLKKDLGIKSPSTVFKELGQFVTKGLAAGLKNATPDVEDATAYVAKTAVDSMTKALSDASDAITNSVDMNPVIAPVVDLSNVHKSVSQLDAILTDKKLNVNASFNTAKDASAGYLANKIAAAAAVETTTTEMAPGDVTFIQNNNSPKALSTAEIYRQTNNQLSRAKGALTTNVA